MGSLTFPLYMSECPDSTVVHQRSIRKKTDRLIQGDHLLRLTQGQGFFLWNSTALNNHGQKIARRILWPARPVWPGIFRPARLKNYKSGKQDLSTTQTPLIIREERLKM
jgi:hypothetical protein